jgi:hypothetical protein
MPDAVEMTQILNIEAELEREGVPHAAARVGSC